MNGKSYIAIVLVTVFLVKFIAMDSKLLIHFFEKDTIAYVNPYCKKTDKKHKDTSGKKNLLEKADTMSVVSIIAPCLTSFVIGFVGDMHQVVHKPILGVTYFSESDYSHFIDIHSPPPKPFI